MLFAYELYFLDFVSWINYLVVPILIIIMKISKNTKIQIIMQERLKSTTIKEGPDLPWFTHFGLLQHVSSLYIMEWMQTTLQYCFTIFPHFLVSSPPYE